MTSDRKAWAAPPLATSGSDLGALLALLRHRILVYARAKVGPAEGEDLTQEVLTVLVEKYSHLDSLEDLVPLSFRILHNKRLELYRRLRRDRSPEPLPASPEMPADETLLERERRRLLREAITLLSGRCRELLRLQLLGYGFGEIQRLMKARAINTVYTWARRCRESLRSEIERLEGRLASDG